MKVVGIGVLVILVAATMMLSWSSNDPPQKSRLADSRETTAALVAEAPPIPSTPAVPTQFREVEDAAGLHYVWQLPGSAPRNILQTIGNGCAFLDYDGDGNLDALMVGMHPALFRGDGHGRFKDVTTTVGLDKCSGYFLGCAVGDFDNDGYPDIFLTGYHIAVLLHNDGGHSFTDVTKQSGIDTSTWSTSAAWGDVDNDGKLDLYICDYCSFNASDKQTCASLGFQSGCDPSVYNPEFGHLYRNTGHGMFVDVTKAMGVDSVSGKDLGAAFADFDGSGHQSLYVANDRMPSNLFRNFGAGFQEIGKASGTAVKQDGHPFSGMGVDWGDYDSDGKLDLAVMDYWKEDKGIYHNDGGGLFENQYQPLGFPVGGFPRVAFGVKWFDYDNDGWLDIMYCSGHTMDNVHDIQPSFTFPEPTLLYHHAGGTHFDNVSAGLDTGMRPSVGRGLAVGDFDYDGRVDALVVDSNGKPLLLHNETPSVGHWIQLRLIGVQSNRDGYGAKVSVEAGSMKVTRICHADGSYMSSSDPRVHVGLGGASVAKRVVITWPSGVKDMLTDVPADRVLTISERQTQKH